MDNSQIENAFIRRFTDRKNYIEYLTWPWNMSKMCQRQDIQARQVIIYNKDVSLNGRRLLSGFIVFSKWYLLWQT